jgi:dTDP-glucose pyrophosphorylase
MILKEKIERILIHPNSTILSALKQMDRLGKKSLMVSVGNFHFDGILSIGDIQRALINNVSLKKTVKSILRSAPKVLFEGDLVDHKNIMVKYRMEFLPVINKETSEIKDIFYWNDIFGDKEISPLSTFNLPVIIMAGGYGTRLKPLTNVIPKPLIPIGNQTIIEDIFERFSKHGCNRFFVSLNYKADLVEYYLSNRTTEINVTYFREEKPLGTAGSLKLLKNSLDETFFVSNCDILIDQDYSEILKFHKESQNLITVVAALKHFPIPYGTIETGIKGVIKKLDEKPEITYKINSGMYILESEIIDYIPKNSFYHITHLIEKVNIDGGKVGVFPISENSWKDFGNWNELRKYYF